MAKAAHVVFLSDHELVGGAAMAAGWLAEGLVRIGCKVTRIVAAGDNRPHVWQTVALQKRSWGVQRIASYLSPDFAEELQNNDLATTLARTLQQLQPDFISVHNIHSAGWPLDLIKVCCRTAPTVWTLHDMWTFTGRCGYSFECKQYLDGCSDTCPTASEYPVLAPFRVAGSWNDRKKLFSEFPQLAATAPSKWLAETARSGLWRSNRVEHIPYGMPHDFYQPPDHHAARKALGIDENSLVLLAAADDLRGRRKGGAILEKALSLVKHRPLTLITLGHGRLQIEAAGVNYVFMGHITCSEIKRLVFSAADIFVHPAPVDNLPLVVLESMACGTPVVGFPVGGIPDMVRPGQTGWLAPEVSAESFAATIDKALREVRGGLDLRLKCRAVIESEYELETQAERYLEFCLSLAKEAKCESSALAS